jgi:hypothetical protein
MLEALSFARNRPLGPANASEVQKAQMRTTAADDCYPGGVNFRKGRTLSWDGKDAACPATAGRLPCLRQAGGRQAPTPTSSYHFAKN